MFDPPSAEIACSLARARFWQDERLRLIGTHPEWHYGSMVFNSDTIIATLISAAVVLILGFLVRAKVSAEKPGKLQLALPSCDDLQKTVHVLPS